MLKITFSIINREGVAGHSPRGLCVPLPDGIRPALGETWLVEVAGAAPLRYLYVRPVRRWRGLPADYEAIEKGQPDFKKGILSFRGGVSFPLSKTGYARAWADYRVLEKNRDAVIIRDGKAVRWRKKGQTPEEMPLHRFATKYKRQPLLGEREEIENFLKSLEVLKARAIEAARGKGNDKVARGCRASGNETLLRP